MKYVVYEVWTKARVIDADNIHQAFSLAEPVPPRDTDLSLSNWHVVPVPANNKG